MLQRQSPTPLFVVHRAAHPASQSSRGVLDRHDLKALTPAASSVAPKFANGHAPVGNDCSSMQGHRVSSGSTRRSTGASAHEPARFFPHRLGLAGVTRSWWTDVPPADLNAEFAWLAEVYRQNGRILNAVALPRRDVTAHDRWRADPLEVSP